MKTFRVYMHPVNGLEAVKAGFSWPAFCFSCLWMLEKELWRLAALWFGLQTLAGVLALLLAISHSDGSAPLFLVVMLVVLQLIAGANSNRWREQHLRRRRYELLTTIVASTPYEAIERAFGSTRCKLDFVAHA